MPASINDKLRKVYQTFSTTLAAQKAQGASSMSLSSATGVPTSTAIDFTVGRVDANGTRTPSAKAVYKGTLSGTTVSNLTLIEGTDQLHNAGTVVEITWTASTWNDAVDHLLSEHNQDGTHGAVTADSLSTDTISEATAAAGVTVDGVLLKDNKIATAGAVENTAVMLGMPVQVVSTTSNAVTTGTGTIPSDDTIPQNTEGNEFMTLAITPKSATNILVIEVNAMLSSNIGAFTLLIGALFQDTTANALAAAATDSAGSSVYKMLPLRHTMVAGTTSATTFKFRAGSSAAGTTTFNGVGGARRFGDIVKSSVVITEYKAA